MNRAPLRFLTIGPSHYCEKARWALDRARIAYAEEVHLPILHWPFVMAASGTKTVPALVGEGVRLVESRDILLFADAALEAEARLYPAAPNDRAEVVALEARFDADLGPLVRRLIYCHLVPRAALFVAAFAPSAPPLERRLLRLGHPALRAAMGRAFKVSPRALERGAVKLRSLFDDVSRELEDKRFFVGERFSAADLTFAALSTPILFPDEHGSPSLQRGDLPEDLGRVVDELRETTAGQHAMRMYRELRRVPGAA